MNESISYITVDKVYAFWSLINRKISVYVLEHKFPFTGTLLAVYSSYIIMETIESDCQVFFIDKIVSFHEYKESKKYL
jgi:hypothetical protein